MHEKYTIEKNTRPSRLAIRFLRWFCPSGLYESIYGDLLEQFEVDYKQAGEKTAQRRFVWNVIRFFRPGIVLRNSFPATLTNFDMVRNDLKIAYRSLKRQRLYSLISIGGLALGFTVCLYMLIYVLDELSYDRHFDDAQQVYRVSLVHEGERAFNSAWTTTTLGYAFKEKYPDVEAFTTFQKYWKGFSVKQNGNELPVQTTYLASDDFLELFTFDLLAGDRNQVLKSPENIVLSSDLAHRLFASVDVLGESIETTFGEKVISGVLAPVTENSHLEAPDVIIPIVGFSGKHDVLQDWTRDAAYYNYIRLRNGTEFSGIREKLEAGGKDFAERWMRESNSGGGQLGEGQVRLEFQRITDIHLFSHKEFEIKPNGNPLYVYTFSTVAVLLLFIAAINYINLTTARSAGRAREVGIRKTLGSRYVQLVRQFMTESALVILCAILLSLLLVAFLLPYFNSLAGRSFGLVNVFNSEVAFVVCAIAVMTTLLGGF
ncbi:MAG TPA: permease prefix domain 2-containing transporter, partial [Cyclobacteriaceae bacterium]